MKWPAATVLVGYISIEICALYRQSGSDHLAGGPFLIATKRMLISGTGHLGCPRSSDDLAIVEAHGIGGNALFKPVLRN
jgi:hypothetical protein